jgi:hypothetical protein
MMPNSEHTPGPWERVGASYIWKTGDNGAAVAIVAEPECSDSSSFYQVRMASKRWDEAMANARLIAAAPELLEACKALYALFDDEGVFREEWQDQASVAFEAAEAAIAKAGGRE